MNRPDFSTIKTGAAFNQWYWLKREMVDICKQAGLPCHGSKFELRDRIMYALDHQGSVKPKVKTKKATSTFHWAKAELTLDTVITNDVSFGPNFRGFMEAQTTRKFTCHSDFMDWVRANSGKTLQDAILAWEAFENRKEDPAFRREIAEHNMYCQYVRDFLNDNPGQSFSHAKNHWNRKRQLPMKEGLVKYERSDLTLISS